jgi:hypothetical protein
MFFLILFLNNNYIEVHDTLDIFLYRKRQYEQK